MQADSFALVFVFGRGMLWLLDERVRNDRSSRQHSWGVVGTVARARRVHELRFHVEAESLGGSRCAGDAHSPAFLGRGHPGRVAPHPHSKALLQPAVLAAVPRMLRNLALLVASALVAKLLADAPLEETLAAFARDGAVVSSCAKSRLHAKFGQGKAGWCLCSNGTPCKLGKSGKVVGTCCVGHHLPPTVPQCSTALLLSLQPSVDI